jgi:hypothetical protein
LNISGNKFRNVKRAIHNQNIKCPHCDYYYKSSSKNIETFYKQKLAAVLINKLGMSETACGACRKKYYVTISIGNYNTIKFVSFPKSQLKIIKEQLKAGVYDEYIPEE